MKNKNVIRSGEYKGFRIRYPSKCFYAYRSMHLDGYYIMLCDGGNSLIIRFEKSPNKVDILLDTLSKILFPYGFVNATKKSEMRVFK